MNPILPLLQFSDATFPVGTFSFSNGLETASYEGLVHDAASLEQYTRAAALQAAFSDGVAALHAYRAALEGRYDDILAADEALLRFKMNDEARLMLKRMGKKLAELGVHLWGEDSLMARWLEDIKAGKTPGCYPVAQGMAFAAAGIGERELYASHQYGVANMVVSAALRCVRVSHYDTQRILFNLAADTDAHYEQARAMTLDQMHAFVPEMDIMASLHEKGKMRMFMN
ncbi:MAG: urease accessory protein UreF [Muribaculaceae bacterium]|nr:urease accessory protein UreF [Muribaculaceae bacterium]